MNYFIDTEFLEGPQDKTFLGIKIGITKPTIDLISIGIISEDNREYYAISKDFNLKEAWNRHQLILPESMGDEPIKEYWIRENVLIPIFFELAYREFHNSHFKEDWYYKQELVTLEVFGTNLSWISDYNWFKILINKYGKNNEEISEEVEFFIRKGNHVNCKTDRLQNDTTKKNVEFYAYYADYDWVVFCWLFGKMNSLPKGFPKYCNDLKQELDRFVNLEMKHNSQWTTKSFDDCLTLIQNLKSYPTQINAHNALADAKWNKNLHQFLINLHDNN